MPNDAYPFMAALLIKRPGNALGRIGCGGSLISAVTVMTAAHCVAGVDPSVFEVVVGRAVLSNDQQGQVRNITEIKPNPK